MFCQVFGDCVSYLKLDETYYILRQERDRVCRGENSDNGEESVECDVCGSENGEGYVELFDTTLVRLKRRTHTVKSNGVNLNSRREMVVVLKTTDGLREREK